MTSRSTCLVALTAVALIPSPASAQNPNVFQRDSGRVQSFPQQGAPAAPVLKWAQISREVFNCVDQRLQRDRGASARYFMDRGLSPSSPEISQVVAACQRETPAVVVSAPPSPSEIVPHFVEWMNTAILAKPLFAKAFNQCREIVSLYQDKILQRLQAAEAAAASKSDQIRIRTARDEFGVKKETAAKFACTKQFIASLGIAGSSSGYYADELASLNGKLLDNRINLREAAAVKVNDLTEKGMMQLALKMGLEHLQAQVLQAEIDGVGQYGSGSGFLACLLPSDWVGVSPEVSAPCHGAYLEKKVAEMAVLLKLP